MNDLLERRIRAYLATLPPAVSGQKGHRETLHAASVLVHGFALSENQAWPFIYEYNAQCMPPWSERDLRRKLSQAANYPRHLHPRGYLLGNGPDNFQRQPLPPPPPKPVYQPDKLSRVAGRVQPEIDIAYLEARSKFTCWNRSPAGALHKLFRPGEHVVVFNVFKDQGCEVWTHPGIAGNLATLNYLQTGQRFGAWFMANPVHGEFICADRLKTRYNPEGRSRRCEECVTAWRYLVIESDDAPPDLWLRSLVQLPLRISSIYTSGGKSVHALVRIDAESKIHWDDIVRGELLPILVPLGACDGSMTAVRLTRLPNCMREEKGQRQTLLYITDEPDAVPICEKPLREPPEAVWMRWGESLVFWSYDDSINPNTKTDARTCAEGLRRFSDSDHVRERINQLEKLYVS